MGATPRILVAGNEPAEVRSVIRSLRDAGYEVDVADDGIAAAQAVAERKPDVILLAGGLPERERLETGRFLGAHEDGSTVPVILIGAHADTDAEVEALVSGGLEYVSQPFRPAEVVARLSAHLRLVQTERELADQRVCLVKLAKELADARAALARLDRTDSLTRLLNWRVWRVVAAAEYQRAKRYDRDYSILIVDLDEFKSFNEVRGHQTGDACLTQVAQCLARGCRAADIIGRDSGGAFLIFASETNVQAACELGERLRKSIRALGIPHPESDVTKVVTASIGIAGREFGPWEDTFKRAGEALLIAKRAGRDRVYADHHTLLADQDHRTDDGRSSTTSGLQERAPSVLLVTDNSDDRVLCRDSLERSGYRVREVTHGGAALAAVEKQRPHVIIMDATLPDISGPDCVRQLKADPSTRDIPVVLVGTPSEGTDPPAGLDVRADEWLARPIRTLELVLRVQSMLRLRHEHQDLLQSYEARGEQARVLMVLIDFCQALAVAASLDEVLAHAVAVTADVCACRRVSIMLPDAHLRVLTIASSKGIDARLADAVRVSFGEAIAGCVFLAGRPVVANTEEDICFDGAAADAEFFTGVPLVSSPLGASSQVVGVLNVTDRIGGRPFKSQELKYIDLIANIAGSAIHGLLSRQSRDQARDSIVVALAKLAEHRDNDTGKHVDRVTQYCLILARDLRRRGRFAREIDDAFLYALERAAPLHDIGKVAVPDHILLKPGRLTPQEMAVMRPHTVIGAETIRSVTERAPGVQFLDMAEQIAYCHHEWWDGSGYPRGLSGETIPLCARIAALADVYDALTTQRAYKKAFSHDRSAAIIVESSGTQFDPDVVDAFLRRERQFADLATELADTPSPTQPHGLRPQLAVPVTTADVRK